MSIAAFAIVTNSLPYFWPCCTDSKAHSTGGTPVNVVIRTAVVLMLMLKLKLLERYFIEISEVLAANKLNCLRMHIPRRFRSSV